MTPVCPSRGTVPDIYQTLQKRVSQDSCTMFRAFNFSGQISTKPGTLPQGSCLTTLSISNSVLGEASLQSSDFAIFNLTLSFTTDIHQPSLGRCYNKQHLPSYHSSYQPPHQQRLYGGFIHAARLVINLPKPHKKAMIFFSEQYFIIY